MESLNLKPFSFEKAKEVLRKIEDDIQPKLF